MNRFPPLYESFDFIYATTNKKKFLHYFKASNFKPTGLKLKLANIKNARIFEKMNKMFMFGLNACI